MSPTTNTGGDDTRRGGGFGGGRAGRLLAAAGIPFALFLLATVLTDATLMGDTSDYVDSVVAYDAGRYYKFWEFGHLVWRPLGWLTFRALRPVTEQFVGADIRANVFASFLVLNWLSGLLSAALVHAIARRLCHNNLFAATVTTAAFVFTQGFLNYTQTGCSYVPGLAMLLVGIYILIAWGNRPERARLAGLLAGLSLAACLCLWFLYLWALPAAVVPHLFVHGWNRRGLRLAIETTVVLGVVSGLAYALVLWRLDIYTVAALKHWISPEGAPPIRGVSRMIFGFARSLINMGNDGAMFKRYLIGDPFNPVTLAQLVRLSLWKFFFFYLFLAALVVALWRAPRGRKVLAWLAVAGVPVIGFAVFFLGGDLERYAPLYPALFAALAFALCGATATGAALRRPLQLVILAFVATLVVVNARALSKTTLARQQRESVARVEELLPRLRPESKVFAANWHDELINFNRSFPFHPVNRDPRLKLLAVVTPSSPWLPRWREDFARATVETWRRGGDVWLSRRALVARPRLEWNWVEGDDRRISWADLHAFFAPLDAGAAVGGEDGFVMLARTPRNEQVMRELAERAAAQPPLGAHD